MRSQIQLSVVVSVLVLTGVLNGCNASVESFQLVVERGDDRRPVELRDLGRRPADRENRVVGGARRPFRFRVAEESAREIAPDSDRLVVSVSGGWTRGGLLIREESVTREISFATVLSGTDGAPPVPVSMAVAPPRRLGEQTEFEFLPGGASEYRVETMRIEPRPPRVTFGERWELDERLPVSLEAGAIVVDGLGTVIESPDDALAIRYHAPETIFTDRVQRPALLVELLTADGRSEPFAVHARPGERSVVMRPLRWGVAARSIRIVPGDVGIEVLAVEVLPRVEGPHQPIPIELSELLTRTAQGWRRETFEVFSWSIYPDLLWIDTRDYATQAAMFKRLAFFVEKRGFRGTLLTNDELAGRHGWNAHNYRPEGLADFFNAVDAQQFPLNPIEEELREVLLNNGVIARNTAGRYVPGRGGVLVVSQESYLELRRLLIAHEAMHGVFYESEQFVTEVERYWNLTLGERERDFWREFLAWASYDPSDEYLMVNEFQGYLLQQHQGAVRWYFRTRVADRLRRGRPDRAARVDAFLADHPRTFVDAAEAMNAAIFAASGLLGGDPFCVAPVGMEG